MIQFQNLSMKLGAFRLENISLEVPANFHAVLMGKTGSGKTSLLEALCGLRQVSSGSICVMGRDVTRLPPATRNIGYVPQDGALFSSMTIREHLSFALTLRQWDESAISKRVAELAELLQITHLLERYPRGLSGGEVQRVSLGRALSFRPRILCMDEPLSALDDETRTGMCRLLIAMRQNTPVTVLHVSHNRAEADMLADRVFVLREGRIETHTFGAP
jgi:ABC-type sugar transport system ATPase subunit